MSGEMHLYRAPGQPLTRYRDRSFEDAIGAKRPRYFRCSPFKLAWCHVCRHRRRASSLLIQVYYDMSHVFCRDREACKEAKRSRRRRRHGHALGWPMAVMVPIIVAFGMSAYLAGLLEGR